MSDEYWLLRANYLQKVCYVILVDVPNFKVTAIVNQIFSYFEKNNVDIFISYFPVSFDFYKKWIQLFVSEDLIAMDSKYDSVFDDTQLSSIKNHITSTKYELEIEPNATIRIYNGNTSEMIFNEWFNDVSSSDKRKEKGMSDNTVSPALSKIEERMNQLKQLERDNNTVEVDIQQHKNAIEALSFKRDELNEDILHVRSRIQYLCGQAMVEEGFTEDYIHQFLKARGYKQQ